MQLASKSLGRIIPAILLGIAALTFSATARGAAPDRHVVVICVDGLAAYLIDDPKAPLPTIRRLAREGAIVDGGMRVSNPSVTWPNHTSLVTGVRPEKHGVLANGVFVRGAPGVPVFVDPRRDKSSLVRVPTIYDALHEAGMTTAEVNWPCTRGAKTLDDSFPDVPEAVTHSTPRLKAELVKLGLLSEATDKAFGTNSTVGRDYIWTETACHIIRQRKPNLLLLHLLNVDSTHHAEGAQSPPGYTANAYADMCVAKVLAALDEAGIRAKTTVLLVADHGFTLTPKSIRPNAVFRKEGMLTLGGGGKITEARVHVISEGGTGLVYCTDPSSADADRKRVKELLAGKEGVAEVLEPAEFAKYGLPHPREYSQAPDLVVVTQDGYGVSTMAEGDDWVVGNTEGKVSLGSHGFISTLSKMNAPCILSGAAIRRGAHLKEAENIDVAPTVAKLLGLRDFGGDGRVLTNALAGE